jgi:hypothetical protein
MALSPAVGGSCVDDYDCAGDTTVCQNFKQVPYIDLVYQIGTCVQPPPPPQQLQRTRASAFHPVHSLIALSQRLEGLACVRVTALAPSATKVNA